MFIIAWKWLTGNWQIVGVAALAGLLIGAGVYVANLRHKAAELQTAVDVAVGANKQFQATLIAKDAQIAAGDTAVQELSLKTAARIRVITKIEKEVDHVATQNDLTVCAPGVAAALGGLRNDPQYSDTVSSPDKHPK